MVVCHTHAAPSGAHSHMNALSQEPESPTADDEISLLDLLVVVVENLRLLVIGPLLVGLAGLGIGYLLPQTYESTSVLAAEKTISLEKDRVQAIFTATTVASMATSANVLDPVAQNLGLLQKNSIEEARIRLLQQVKATVGKQDKLLTLITQSDTPEGAKQLNQAVLDAVFQQTQPKGPDHARLVARLAQERALRDEALALQAALTKQVATGGAQGEKVYATLSDLINSASERLTRIQSLEAQLEGLTSSNVLQAPTLPNRPEKPKKAMIAVLAALTYGIALLLFIFWRQAWRNAAKNLKISVKLLRIRRALAAGGRG
jgi:uncharacterized protein involved in exopolysaccharide biosynthesis